MSDNERQARARHARANAAPRRARARPRAAPDALRRVRRPAQDHGEPAGVRAGRASSATSRSTTCCCAARRASARPPSRTSSATSSARNVATAHGPAIEHKGQLAALLTRMERGDVLFIDEIHRLEPGDRREPLHRGRGLPDRHRAGRRAVRRDAAAAARAVHAGRRDHAHRPAHQPDAVALRHRRAARLLPGRRARRGRARAARGCLQIELADDAALRDRAPRARHAAHRQPPAAPRARLRDGARRRQASTRKVAADALDAARGRRRRARRDGPAAPARRSSSTTRAARSASIRWPPCSASRATRSRTCTSRSCCSRASWRAPRAAAS